MHESDLVKNIPCKPTNITTLGFAFFGVKEGFPGSSILQSSLNIAYNEKDPLIRLRAQQIPRHNIQKRLSLFLFCFCFCIYFDNEDCSCMS